MNTMSLDVTPARSATSVAGARDSARDFLEGLVRPLAAEGADTVLLVVSELVTNALRHGGGGCTLELTAHPDSIEVTVHDDSPKVCRACAPRSERRHGRLRLAHGQPPRSHHLGDPPGDGRQDGERPPRPVTPAVGSGG